MVETIHLLSQSVDQKATSIKRLLRMLFGDRTEKLKDVIKNKEKDKSPKPGTSSEDTTDKNDKPKPKGHGRNAAVEYTGADQVKVPHESLKPGDNCPGCLSGKLYEMKVPILNEFISLGRTCKRSMPLSPYNVNLLIALSKRTPSIFSDLQSDSGSALVKQRVKRGSGLSPLNCVKNEDLTPCPSASSYFGICGPEAPKATTAPKKLSA